MPAYQEDIKLMKSLYYSRCQSLIPYAGDGVKVWGSINKLIGHNVGLVDRAGGVTMPFNFKIYPGFEMPSLQGLSFNMTYDDCCNERAQYIINNFTSAQHIWFLYPKMTLFLFT